jgi:hypothetical protein
VATPCGFESHPGQTNLQVSAGNADHQLEVVAQTTANARCAGDSEMVVSATPSENTVRFYPGRGYELMAEPLPELFELEPEDVHMKKRL